MEEGKITIQIIVWFTSNNINRCSEISPLLIICFAPFCSFYALGVPTPSLLRGLDLNPSPIYLLSTSDKTQASHADQRLKQVLPFSIKVNVGMKGTWQAVSNKLACVVYMFTLFRLKIHDRLQGGFIFNVHISNSKIFCICCNQNYIMIVFQNSSEISSNKIFLVEWLKVAMNFP